MVVLKPPLCRAAAHISNILFWTKDGKTRSSCRWPWYPEWSVRPWCYWNQELSLNPITWHKTLFPSSKHMRQTFPDLWPLSIATPSEMIWLPAWCLWQSISLCRQLISISSNQTLLFCSSSATSPISCFSVATASAVHPVSALPRKEVSVFPLGTWWWGLVCLPLRFE